MVKVNIFAPKVYILSWNYLNLVKKSYCVYDKINLKSLSDGVVTCDT